MFALCDIMISKLSWLIIVNSSLPTCLILFALRSTKQGLLHTHNIRMCEIDIGNPKYTILFQVRNFYSPF